MDETTADLGFEQEVEQEVELKPNGMPVGGFPEIEPEPVVQKIRRAAYTLRPRARSVARSSNGGFSVNGKQAANLTINGKTVASLYINGKMAYGGGVQGAVALTSRQDGSTVKIAHYGTDACDVNLEYKTGDGWQPYTLGTLLNIANGGTVYFRNTTGTFSVSDKNWISIVARGAWDVSGELNALLDYRVQAEAVPNYAFNQLFFDEET